jgi:hypothetical protein
MVVGISIFIAFTGAVAFLLFSYERPTRTRRKMTGRGGDFAE